MPDDDAVFFADAEFCADGPPTKEGRHSVLISVEYEVFGRHEHVERSVREIERLTQQAHPEAKVSVVSDTEIEVTGDLWTGNHEIDTHITVTTNGDQARGMPVTLSDDL
jgi:hypothetical protein